MIPRDDVDDPFEEGGSDTADSDLERAVSIDPPSVKIPEAPTVGDAQRDGTGEGLKDSIQEIDPDLLRLFVASVLALNLALLSVSLGAMVWYFEGMDRVGGALILVGVVAGFRTYQYYREYDAREWNDEDEGAKETADVDDGANGTADDGAGRA